jgi:two-component system, cell cycle sensor histidine kinase and response regulator CckA
MRSKLLFVAVRTSLLFWIISVVWILLSDRALIMIVGDPAVANSLQTYKGWFFVTVTAVFLYLLLRRQLRSWEHEASARKEAEDAIRESEERFRAALYSIGDGVVTTDTQGCIVRMNHVAESLTGWTEQEARGKPIEEVFRILNEETGESLLNPVRRVLAGEATVELTAHSSLISRTGARRPIADSGAPITSSRGEVTGVVLVFNDQTERREMQAELMQAQKMEAVGRLAGGIAHDFNNMIGVILGYATLMKGKLGTGDPLMKHTSAIIAAAQRSADLTRQLLAFARKQMIAPRPLDLNHSIASMEKMLQRLIGEDITLTIAPGAGLWVTKIDPVQLDQILANLSTNARDAIEGVGSITIGTGNVTIDETSHRGPGDVEPGEYVVLTFSDDGRGMDRSVQQRIFEPFFTTKGKDRGTGLGLATVFGIVKQNAGFINLESTVGRGSTFRIYFPRFHGEAVDQAPSEKPSALCGRETVLVVEDEEQLLSLAVQVLKEKGYTVHSAKSPGEALLLCTGIPEPIDLLVTDVVMPGMNGMELREQIERLKPGIKVMYMSGYTETAGPLKDIVEAGVDFLQKPFTPEGLARKIREVLDGDSRSGA